MPGILAMAVAAMLAGFGGFGLNLFGSPLLLLLYGPKMAVGMTLMLSLVTTAAAAVVPDRGGTVERKTVALLSAASLAGLPVGALILAWSDPRTLRLLIGMVVVISAALSLRARRVGVGVGLGTTSGAALAAGVISGVLSTSTALNGPPLVAYYTARGVGKATFRASVAATLFITTAASIAVLLLGGAVGPATALAIVPLVPGVLVGFAAGTYLYQRASAEQFRGVVLLGMAGIGVVTILSALGV